MTFRTKAAANDLKEWLATSAPAYFDGHWTVRKVSGGFQVFEFDSEGESWAVGRRSS